MFTADTVLSNFVLLKQTQFYKSFIALFPENGSI